MNGIEFRAALRSGRRSYGTLVASTSPRFVPLLSALPLDFVFIDTEHIPIDRAQLSWMAWAYRNAGLAPMVRIPSPDPFAACQVLDGGACAVVAPYIESAAEVRALVGAVKNRPVKGAKLESMLTGSEPFPPELRAYVDHYNEANALLVNIESVPAIAALDEILAVPGLDGVLIGPHDLSCSLGQPEGYDSPEFEAAVVDILRRARAAGLGAGIHSWMPAEREAAWCAAGANFIIHSSDLTATRVALGAEITALRRLTGDEECRGATDQGTV